MPDRKATGWQTRSLDFYPDARKSSDALALWDLPLARTGPSAERPPSLELLLRENSVDLIGHLASNGNGHRSGAAHDEVVFFRVPLDTARLAGFRSLDPSEGLDEGAGSPAPEEALQGANSWHAFYADRNESLGIEWQLRLRDLNRKSEWERWKILESAAIPVTTRGE